MVMMLPVLHDLFHCEVTVLAVLPGSALPPDLLYLCGLVEVQAHVQIKPELCHKLCQQLTDPAGG